jgi:hypothetical protein
MRPTSLILALTLPLARLQAQSAPPDSGAEVRITLAPHLEPHRLQGRLLSIDADSVRLLDEVRGRAVSLSRSQVALVQVRDGRRSNVARNAAIGTAVGIGAGLGYSLLKSAVSGICPAPEGWDCTSNVQPSSASDAVKTAAIGGAVGLVTGALIGLATHNDAWKTVSPSRATTLLLRPGARGAGAVGLSIKF